MGIGDWAQSPIPNPQSPIPNPHYKKNMKIKIIFNYFNYINIFIILINLKKIILIF